MKTDPTIQLSQIPSNWQRFTVLTPEVAVGDISTNIQRIARLYKTAATNQSLLAITPELSLTGYGLGDAFLFDNLPENSTKGLLSLAQKTTGQPTTLVIGAPILYESVLYNCAVVLAKGQIVGVVPKIHLANYGEFYEKRWFESGKNITNATVTIAGQAVPFGVDLLFNAGGTTFGIEICEDLWVADPPSRKLTEAGAEIICNLSASTEIVGKVSTRRNLVTQTADRLLAGYIYSSADPTDSTCDVVMSGHGIISEFDNILNERLPLSNEKRVLSADIDIAHIRHERQRNQSWQTKGRDRFRTIECGSEAPELKKGLREVSPKPFVPDDTAEREAVTNHILNLQAHGLKKRMEKISRDGKYPKVVLGLSGGLDSTLALLVAARACDLLGAPRDTIHTLTMPANASSERTQDNATLLAQALGTTHEIIEIQTLVDTHLKALSHDGVTQDTTYENVQARTRTELLFNRSNQVNGLVLGTGDLSELALGWCTYNGDHMSNYAVNASVPKTLVRYIVETASMQTEFIKAKKVLQDILATPVSPELTGDGNLSQETEDIIGPYELHDFFIYHLMRWGSTKRTLEILANYAFKDRYTSEEITKWLETFCTRFVTQQFKRNCMPDGVKVGRITFSPRGDLRFPSDAELAILEVNDE